MSKFCSKCSLAVFFKLLTLFLCFLYLSISDCLLIFFAILRIRSRFLISLLSSLLNHGLSLLRIVTILVGMHSLATLRNFSVKYVVAMVDPTKSTKSQIKKKKSHESVNTLPKTLIKDERNSLKVLIYTLQDFFFKKITKTADKLFLFWQIRV